jgi:hypothetical protein
MDVGQVLQGSHEHRGLGTISELLPPHNGSTLDMLFGANDHELTEKLGPYIYCQISFLLNTRL